MPELIMDREKAMQSVCGESPTAKVIDFIMHNPDEEFTISQIAEGARIARTTLWDGVLDELLNIGFLKKTKEIGNAKLFALNKDSKVTKAILNFYENLVEGKRE